MDRKEFEKKLADGSLATVLLFEGEEEQLKQNALAALRKAILPPGMEEMNEMILDDPETDQLVAAAETLPFLADRRLIVVRDHPALTGRGESDDRLVSYLPSVPDTALLLFYCNGKPDARKKLFSAVKKLGGVVTFARLSGAELTRFVTDAFRSAGKECDARTADYLIFTVGNDAERLLSEAVKIASFAGDRPSVTADDVSALATPSTECTVFQLVDAVVTGQKKRAFTLLKNQLLNGTEPAAMLALLLRQYRFLQHIKIMQYEKKIRDFIRSALGVPPFALDQYLRQASQYTGSQVKKAAELCFSTEYGFKSGRLQVASALEALVIKLLNLRDPDRDA